MRVAITQQSPDNARLLRLRKLYGGLIGPLAIVSCEPRQARKGATVAVRLCAGVWLVRLPPTSFPDFSLQRITYDLSGRSFIIAAVF